MAEAPAVAQRIVPGAPPPAPLSKSQKKKRKGGKKGDETGVDSPVAANGGGSVIGAESEHPEPEEKGLEPPTVPGTNGTHTPALVDEDSGLKLSPIVDLVTKRLKATGKKITRISGYAATDVEKLNDDQKRSIKTLPSLEAVQKELQDVKKAIEVHEAELAHEISAKQNEIEKAAKARTAEAVSAAESTLVDKFNAVLDLIRASHSSGSNAVFLHALLGDDQETRKTVLSGLLSGEGEYEGVSYSQALEEVYSTLHGSAPEPDSVTEEIAEQENQPGPGVAISGLPSTLPSGGLQFLHESEIERPSEESPAPYTEEIEEEIPNGHAHQAPVETAPQSSTIDWAADDEHDLPPIAGLHAEFGSGSQTPAADAPGTPAEAEYQGQDEYTPETPGTPNPDVDDDGFVQARPGRGRSRGGRGGEHGGRGGRGGFRGDGRGGYRGGGRGNFRGGERGERGGFRGGDRGAFRGGERGGRGGFRGRPDGEFRGGRGGFRGGRGGDRGGHRASPTPA